MSNGKLLEGKVCLITGTSRGIGRSVAERFAEEGAIVYANARTLGSIDEWCVENSGKYGTRIIPVYFDVTDYQAVKQSVMEVVKQEKKIDVLVNNAGMVTYELLGMIQFENLRKMFEINVVAVINLMQIVSRIMSRQKSGSIINISSIVGVAGVKGQLAYSSTKGAVISLTKSAAKEMASQNIRVNTIAPGMVDTERFHSVFEKSFSERLSDIGLGRLARPIEIANACIYLGSDLSEYVSGQVLGVDGCTVL